MGMKANAISYALFGLRGSRGEGGRMISIYLIWMFIKGGEGGVWRDLKNFKPFIFNSPKLERFGGGIEESDCRAN